MNQARIGIIGLGRIGKVHAENLVYRIPEAELVMAVDPNPKEVEFTNRLGVQFSTDLDAVFKDDSIEAVIICSPTSTHFPFIEKAAEAGKHIFCEKPLEMSISKIEEIVKITSARNVKLQVGFNRRFDANFSKVQTQVVAGSVGVPHILKITSRDPSPAPIEYLKSSGGLFMDMSIHDFDMARFVVGSEVVEVFAKGAVLVDEKIGEIGDIDTAIVTLRFENGCLAVIDNSRKAIYGYDQRLEVFGSNGMVKIENNHADTATLYNESGRHSGLPFHFFMERYTEAYCEEVRAFAKAIQSDSPVPVSGLDALAATQIAIAAQQSIKENRPVSVEQEKIFIKV